MTNSELKAAIEYALQCSTGAVQQTGYSFERTTPETNKVMLDHLKELLAVQLERAKQPVLGEEHSREVERLHQVCRDTYEVWAGSRRKRRHT